MQHTQSPLEISDDKGRLDVPLIHRFLSEEAYWSLGIPLSTVQRAINHSLCFGGYVDGQQVAFARVITDRATFGYLSDVFVLPDHRGRGHSKALMAAIVGPSRLAGAAPPHAWPPRMPRASMPVLASRRLAPPAA